MRPLTDAEMFGTEEAKPLTDAEMFGAPEIKPLTDSEMFSAPEGEKVSKQEQFAIRTVPDAARSELRAPKPLEVVTRALKGMAGVPINAAAGIYNELAANTPAQIGQLMSAAEDLTNVNIFGNMPEQLQLQADRTTITPERQSPAEEFAQKAGGAVGSSLKSVSMGPGGAGAAYGALEAADVYQTARDQGRGRLDAVVAALPAGVFNYVLEYAGVERLLKGPEIKAGTSALKRLATNLGYGAAVEGLEEGSQTVSTDWVKEMNNLQNETLGQLAKKVNESMILGAIGGASSSVILSKLEQGGAKEIFKKAGMDEQQSTQALGKLAVKIQEEAKNVPHPVTPDVSKEQTQIQTGAQEQDARQARYVATVDKAIADGLTRDQANDLAVGMLNNTMVAPQDEAAYIAHFKNALVNKLPVDQAVQYADMKIRNAKIAQEQQQPAPVQVPAGFQVLKGPGAASPQAEQTDTIPLTRMPAEITVRDEAGNKQTIKPEPGEQFFITPIQQQNGKIKYELHDGEDYKITKNVAQNLIGQYGVPVVKEGEFAMPEGVSEVVKGGDYIGKVSQVQNENRWKVEYPNGKTEEYYNQSDAIIASKSRLGNSTATKFSQYQLPGGENYREVLITAPVENKYQELMNVRKRLDELNNSDRGIEDTYKNLQERKALEVRRDELQNAIPEAYQKTFTSSHWDEPNVLAHLRANDRTTPDGKKVYFIEEVQSDWARETRKKDVVSAVDEQGKEVAPMPQHPLLKNWQELSLKRAIKEAVEKGYDYLAWTTGEQQASRYDLSKQVDSLQYSDSVTYPGTYTVSGIKDGANVISKNGITKEELPNVVGKDIAQKIIDGKGEQLTRKGTGLKYGELKGVDLKIGGEWAKNLYDKQIPNILKDLTGENITSIEIGEQKFNQEGEEIQPGSYMPNQPAIRITPEIRRMVLGQPAKFSSQAGFVSTEPITLEMLKERLAEVKQNIKQAMPHLEAIGRRVMSEGKQSFEAWNSRMKSILGDMWSSFKSAMAAVYSRVSKWWEAQGRMGIVAPGFETPGGKRKKLSSIVKKLGGLDPKKLAKDYNLKDLKGDGLLNVMRNGGWALDEIVDRLQAEGVIIPEDVNPSDWVIEELKRQAGKKVEKVSDRKNEEGYNKAAERQYEREKEVANREVEQYGYSNAEIIEAERDLEADFEADVGREGVQEEAVSPAIYFSDEELALLKQADLPLPAPIANRISGTRTEGTPDLIPGVSMTQSGNAPPIGRGGIQAPAMSEEEYGKTKRKGIFWLTRETFRRNIESIFPKNVADRILAYASNPVMKNEYERISWLNKVRTDTAALLKKLGIGLYDKLDKPIEFEDEAGNKFKITTLDSAIQAYGEKVIDLKTLQNGTKKWQEVVQASEYFRDLYNKIIEKWNTSLRNFGYQPVPRRRDYFRHFRAMGGILDQFGFIFKGGDLPSAIAGLTEWFKPGRPFTTAQLKRLGVRTDYSAIKGFDNYLNSVSQQIYHTDSVQRIRMLEAYMRVVDPEGTKLSSFNNYLREYGNLLAGKTSTIDRSIENAFLGRTALQTMNWLRQRVSANMISANIGASLTNLIPLLTQLPTIVSPAALAKGLHEATISPIKADFATIDGMKSSFLTRRFPVKEIFKTRGEKVGNALGFFFETIDAYTSVATTAAIYYNNLAKVMNQEEAMRQADIEAGKLITDRSFGQLPNLFRSKLLGPITQFQIEVNNMASWIGKDLKVAHGGDRKKHAAALALFFMLSFMFNSIFEKLTGRRPTIDPIHATLILMGLDDQAYKSKEGVKTLKPFSARAGTAAVDMIENLPFGNTLMKFFGGGSGGRLPIEAAIPKGFTVKELSKPVFNLGMPMAGGQVRKSLDGITSFATGGKFNSFGAYLDYQLGADAKKPKFTVEQTPANLARMAVFGPSASAEAKKYYAGR